MARNQYGQDDISHTFTERALSETWEARKARLASERAADEPAPEPRGRGAVIDPETDGRFRAWRWTDEQKRVFKDRYNSGVLYKLIADELTAMGGHDVSVRAVTDMRVQMKLPSRQARAGNGRTRKLAVHFSVTEDEMKRVRKAATRKGMNVAKFYRHVLLTNLDPG